MSDFWRHKSVLVTGANGFVGSWLTQALVESGANVVALIRDIVSNSNFNVLGLTDRVNTVYGSLTDYGVTERAFNEYDVEYCFHLAAQAIVTVANRSPLSTFESNIRGTWNLLEACRNSKTIQGVVVASSDKAYGEQKMLPYTEDSPLLGQYPYDVSKACADILSRSYSRTYGLPVAVTRCANIYGGGDMNPSRIVPSTIMSVLKNEQPVIRSDGTPERDYMYVRDAVRAYMMLGESAKRVSGEAFNFGTASPISVLGLVGRIIKISGRNLTPKVLGKGKLGGEIDRQYLSSEKAKSMLGWKAQYTLDQGLKETYAWYEKHFDKVADMMP